MEKSTVMDRSSSLADTSDMTDKDLMAKRSSTMAKVNARLDEATARVKLIEDAVRDCLVDLIAVHPLGEACDVIASFDAAVKGLDEATGNLKKRVSYAKEVSMVERMDNEECTTFNTELHRVTRTSKMFASIIADVKDKAYAWLRKQGYESLIQETVNSSSLSAAAKELLETGHELPEELFATYPKDGISITRKKKA